VVALIVATVIAVRVVSADANGCSGGIRLNVAANPDLYPAVREAAARWATTTPKVNNDCIHVQVKPVPAADVANALAVRSGAGAFINVAAQPVPTPADDEVPAVWIPDSISWIGRVQAVNREAFDDTIASVAMSPVVLAMPEPLLRTFATAAPPDQTLASAIPHKLTGGDLAGLLQRSLGDKDKSLQVGVAEPRREATGLAGAILMHDAVVSSPAQLPALVGAYRGVRVAADQAALLRAFDQGQTIAPISEQAILAHDSGSPRPPLTAVPLEAAQALDYPYAIVAGKPRPIARAAEQFRSVLLARAYRDILAKAAFRAPNGTAGQGFPVGHGAVAEPVIGNALVDSRKVADVLSIWNGAKIPSRVLGLTDITAVMGNPAAPGSPTRLQIMQKAQLDGLRLFTDDSQIGFWAFASGLSGGKDYQEKVPIGPLNAAQRGRLGLAVTSGRPVGTNGRGLYESVLAAYKVVRDGWDANRSNTVLVCTGGPNAKPGGLSLDDVQVELEKLTDPTKPIRVVLLGFGPDVDLDELNTIAKTTGGKAFRVSRPEEIGGIFLQALLRG
jgi:hypothetical protein